MSTDRQTVENQRYEISRFCDSQHIVINGWIEESISGTCSYRKRRLGVLLNRVKSGDLILCSELSRLGRSLFMIMEILSFCMTKECRVWTIKEGYRLGDDIQSKVLAFAFGLSAEIERNLISQRTREALARRRSQGVRLGRPSGRRSDSHIMDRRAEKARHLLSQGNYTSDVARCLRVSRSTLYRWLNDER